MRCRRRPGRSRAPPMAGSTGRRRRRGSVSARCSWVVPPYGWVAGPSPRTTPDGRGGRWLHPPPPRTAAPTLDGRRRTHPDQATDPPPPTTRPTVTDAAIQDRFYPDNRCFGCGGANPDGLHLKSFDRGEELVAEWVADPRFHRPPGVVNGGLMAVPMDCHGTWAAMLALGAADAGDPVPAVTAGYSVRLLA